MSADPGEMPTVARRSLLSNPAFVAMIGLPVFAIVASLGMTAAAYLRGDPELPQEFHWEGSQLDADFALARRARQLDVHARLQFVPASGTCRLSVRLGSELPGVLRLSLIHGSRPELDQYLRLLGHAGVYETPCRIPSAADWLVEVSDEPVTWRVRQRFSASLADVRLAARPD